MSASSPKARHKACWTLSADAVKLLLIVAVFNFTALLLVSTHRAIDFSGFYTAGRLILQGQRHSIFNPSAVSAFQLHTLGMHAPLPFNHLAYEALLFVPFAVAPYPLAMWLWRIFSLALILCAVSLLAPVYKASRASAAILAVAFFPVALAIVQGQDSTLLFFLVVASLVLAHRNRLPAAGLVLACALFKPHLILPIAAFLVWKRGWPFLSGFAGGTLLVAAVSTAVTGPQGWLQLAHLWRLAATGAGQTIGIFAQRMPNIRGVVTAIGAHGKPELIAVVVLSTLLLVPVFLRLRSVDSVKDLLPSVIAFTMLISFHLNLHDLSLLLVPLVAMLVKDRKSTYLCASACFLLPLFVIFGQVLWFTLVVGAVLYFTLRQLENQSVTPSEPR